MVDHRRLQRVLFLMQLDRSFAERVHAGEEKTCASLGLGTEALSWLQAQELAAISADPGGKRRMQIVGNIAGEFTLSLTAWATTQPAADWLEEFFTTTHFRRAVLEDDRLPLAFGDYAAESASESRDVAAVVEVERALARLRREAVGGRYGALASHRLPHPPGGDRGGPVAVTGNPGEDGEAVWLSGRARLLEVPAGTLGWCEALQASLDAGTAPSQAPPAPPGFPGAEREAVLLFAHRIASPHGPAEVRTELLAPPVDEILRRAQAGFAREARAAFARENGAAPEDLEGFLEGFLGEGVLVRS